MVPRDSTTYRVDRSCRLFGSHPPRPTRTTIMGSYNAGNIPSLTIIEPQSRFGDKLLEIRVVCPQNGTAVPSIYRSWFAALWESIVCSRRELLTSDIFLGLKYLFQGCVIRTGRVKSRGSGRVGCGRIGERCVTRLDP